MKKILKLNVLIFLLICTALTAQEKTEFLLVGVHHEIPDSLSCNWTAALQKLIQYKPDQIAIEYVAPNDSASMIHFLGEDYRNSWNAFILQSEGHGINPNDSVGHYLKLLEQKDNIRNRMLLWKYYYLNTDIGNRDYQSYLLQQNMDKVLAAVDTTDKSSKLFLSNHFRLVEARKNGEFFNLVFPLAKQLDIQYLHPTDYRVTFPLQSEAYVKFAEELADTPVMKKYEDAWKDFSLDNEKQLAGCNAILYTNTKTWLKKSDYLQAKILSDLKNPGYSEYARVWYLRNFFIAGNIIAAAKQSKAKKMVVFYGNMHTFPVKMYLEKRGYKVKLLDDIKS